MYNGRMTNIKALYRQYRPHTFDDVIGQDHVVRVLKGMLSKKEFGHAYLFNGSRGIGKTTLARIFAKELGCAPEDIYEIDGASHRKIEDIRDLRDGVRTLPFSSPYKVYIIDEVHMLTREAFNAFLKTLEEPPQHVIFMLATTEPEKIPDTIISRCQVFQLKKPTMSDVVQNLKRVLEAEKFSIDEGGLQLIAMLARGSFRDGLGILQKVLSISTDAHIDQAEIEMVLGVPSFEYIKEALQGLADHDDEAVFSTLVRLSSESQDVALFVERLLHILRMIFIARYTPGQRSAVKATASEDQWSLVESLIGEDGKTLNAGTLARLLQAQREMKYASLPVVPLELAFMELLGQNT